MFVKKVDLKHNWSMSALLQWGSANPKKATLLSMMGLIYGYKKVKQLLATPKDLTNKVIQTVYVNLHSNFKIVPIL